MTHRADHLGEYQDRLGGRKTEGCLLQGGNGESG